MGSRNDSILGGEAGGHAGYQLRLLARFDKLDPDVVDLLAELLGRIEALEEQLAAEKKRVDDLGVVVGFQAVELGLIAPEPAPAPAPQAKLTPSQRVQRTLELLNECVVVLRGLEDDLVGGDTVAERGRIDALKRLRRYVNTAQSEGESLRNLCAGVE